MKANVKGIDMKTIKEFDNLIGHIVGINDERDVIPLLLTLKDLWPKLRDEIMELKLEAKREMPPAKPDPLRDAQKRYSYHGFAAEFNCPQCVDYYVDGECATGNCPYYRRCHT